MMQCYEHAKVNQPREAVAVCANCGAGLCMEHLGEEREMVPRTNDSKRKIYCKVCAEQK